MTTVHATMISKILAVTHLLQQLDLTCNVSFVFLVIALTTLVLCLIEVVERSVPHRAL